MKMYNKPATEVMDLKTASLMISVSPGGAPTDPTSPPTSQAPKHGEFFE